MQPWTEENKQAAAQLWAKGLAIYRIAVAFDTSEDAIGCLAKRNRSMFPKRPPAPKRNYYRREGANDPIIRRFEPPKPQQPKVRAYADRVTRHTISGAKVTMPRVTFIDGPYLAAAE